MKIRFWKAETFELTEEQEYRKHCATTDYRTCDKSCCLFGQRWDCCAEGFLELPCIHRRFEHHMHFMALSAVIIELDANDELKAYAERVLEENTCSDESCAKCGGIGWVPA